jgi:peroxiredoxin
VRVQTARDERMVGAMNTIIVITDDAVRVPGRLEGSRVLVDVSVLEEATGWIRKTQGLCRDDICVPIKESDLLEVGAVIDLVAMARLLGRRYVIAPEVAIFAMAFDNRVRRGALERLHAPDFELDDLHGHHVRLSDSAGTKRLIVTFASWCGCRYDLPGWDALANELSDQSLTVLAVALDDDPEDVRPFTDRVGIPVLLDRQHVVSELYAISNVPTVIWIDEAGTIVRPNAFAFGTDTFVDFTGVASGPHLDAVRRWVRDGEVALSPKEAAGAVHDLSNDEIDSRLLFRIGIEARRQGQTEVAEAYLRRASSLVPMDFTVTRAAMPLLGEDPFGQSFLDLYDRWKAVGAPYHGLSAEGN